MNARRTVGLLMLATFAAIGCSRETLPDAYGNVEATDVVVGAEAGGRILSFEPTEGATLAAGAVVGAIDSTELSLQRNQIEAERDANRSRINEIAKQADVLDAQRSASAAEQRAAESQAAALMAQYEIAVRNYDRTKRLFTQQAATSQQLDQAEREVRVLDEQIKAQRNQIGAHESQTEAQARQIVAMRAQRQTATAQAAASEARVAQLGERIQRSQVTNPTAGTVLATYVKAGEVVQPGQPLYKIANLESVDVRAYITEPQLAGVKIGQTVQVTADAGKDARRSLTGVVSWISAEAEFTPTPIQTREERADLVYAVKIRVKNDGGMLKIGMPVDVQLSSPPAAR